MDGILLKSADIPSMRIVAELPADVNVFASILSHGEVFKDDPPVVIQKLTGFGFKRGYIENWNGAGLSAGGFMAEFDTEAHATAAVEYMKTELFRPCPDEPTCSSRVHVTGVALPNFVGEALTVLRPTNEQRRHTTLYKLLFRIGTGVFAIEDGGDDEYDPGSVSQAQAVAVVTALYNRVKGKSLDTLFHPTPASPLGPPPPGPGPEPSGPPA